MDLLRTIIGVLLLGFTWLSAMGQGQTVQIVRGSSVVLRADADNALSYLWFRDGEPLNGYDDQRVTVTEPGIYTVMALGYSCDSDMSDPVQVIVDEESPQALVDLRIRNEFDQENVLTGNLFTYQLFIHNDSENTATTVVTVIRLPPEVTYQQIVGSYVGTVTYNPATHELIWEYGDLGAGHSAVLRISVTASRGGTASKWAYVSSDQEDLNHDDNETVAHVEIVELSVPNVFTPNGDGVNDLFVIQGIELFPQHRLVVFNRWGNLIYQSNSYQNDWDGGSFSEGTYYYVFEVQLHNGRWHAFKGFVTIIREKPG